MAMGARKAFEESAHQLRRSWLQIPFLGCDGLPETGQEWVRQGLLAATVFSPLTAPVAIELIAGYLQRGVMPPACTLTDARSIPDLGTLSSKAGAATAG